MAPVCARAVQFRRSAPGAPGQRRGL